MLACNSWLNALDKQMYYKMCENEIDPAAITCVLNVTASLPFCVIVL